MHAHAGDQLRVHGRHVGEPDRCGEILEARGPHGGPPFLVRWDDTDHPVLFFPGVDAVIEPLGHAQTAGGAATKGAFS